MQSEPDSKIGNTIALMEKSSAQGRCDVRHTGRCAQHEIIQSPIAVRPEGYVNHINRKFEDMVHQSLVDRSDSTFSL